MDDQKRPAPVWPDRVLTVVALVVLAAALWRVQMVTRWQIDAPFDLVFESPNLATIEGLRRGANVYDASFFNAPPFVFTMYTPLYHLICAAVPSHSGNPFMAGRLIAMLFMTAAVLGILWVAKPRDWTMLCLAVGLFLLLRPVGSNLSFLKNDGTALFFSVLAVLTVRNWSESNLWLVLAALFCVLAVAAKQVYVAAAAACFVFLFLERHGAALRFALSFLLFATLGAAIAQATWGKGIWWCVFNAPQMPFSADQFAGQWTLMLKQPVFLLLLAVWVAALTEHVYRWRSRPPNPFFLYFLFSGAVLLLTVGKPGSSTNYFIEWSLAGIFWMVSVGPSLLQPVTRGIIAALCLVAVLCELAFAKPHQFAFATPEFLVARAEIHKALLEEAKLVAPEARPLRVLNLAGASTFFDWPGETSVNDPYLYSLLWERGVLKPGAMIQALSTQTYDIVVFRNDAVLVASDRGDGMAEIMKAVREFYRPAGRGVFLHYWVRVPKKTA
jgi:hypothetical protein